MMQNTGFDKLGEVLRRTPVSRLISRISGLQPGHIQISGSTNALALGHQISLVRKADALNGEVVRVAAEVADVIVEGDSSTLTLGSPVVHNGPLLIAPSDEWIGRVLDSRANPIDGKPLAQGSVVRELSGVIPPPTSRRGFGARLNTGLNALNTFFPIVRGQRIGLFAGSGVGKSSLLGTLASELEADVCVIALVGERGREVGAFLRHILGHRGQKKSIVVVATSDEPSLSRRRAALIAMAIAEHFRDQGRHVLFLMDSVTRLAEAHREIAVSAGEMPAMRGFPPSTLPLLAALAERAGPGGVGQGDITAVFSVLVSASDMDEPIADTLRGLLDGHLVLSRDIAERGRFPAIDILRSVSRSLPEAASSEENETLLLARKYLSLYEESETMIRSGLFQPDRDSQLASAARLHGALDGFLGSRQAGGPCESYESLQQILAGA